MNKSLFFLEQNKSCTVNKSSSSHSLREDFLTSYIFFCSVQTKIKHKCTGSHNIKRTVCYKHNVQDIVRDRSPEASCARGSVQDVVRGHVANKISKRRNKGRADRKCLSFTSCRNFFFFFFYRITEIRFKDTVKIIRYVVSSRK